MTTFTTADRKLVELHIKTFPIQPESPPQSDSITSRIPLEQNRVAPKYRIEDESEDLGD